MTGFCSVLLLYLEYKIKLDDAVTIDKFTNIKAFMQLTLHS